MCETVSIYFFFYWSVALWPDKVLEPVALDSRVHILDKGYSWVPNRPHGGKKFTRLIPMGFMSGDISLALAPLSTSFFQPCKFFPTVWSIWNSRVTREHYSSSSSFFWWSLSTAAVITHFVAPRAETKTNKRTDDSMFCKSFWPCFCCCQLWVKGQSMGQN